QRLQLTALQQPMLIPRPRLTIPQLHRRTVPTRVIPRHVNTLPAGTDDGVPGRGWWWRRRGGAGELSRVPGEVPGALGRAGADTGGGAVVVGRAALPVPVDRPEGEPAEPVAGGVVEHVLEVGLVEVLAAVAAAVHAGEPLVGVGRAAVPAEGVHQDRVE